MNLRIGRENSKLRLSLTWTILTTLFTFSPKISATKKSLEIFDFDKLNSIVKKNKVTLIDDLLPLLPATMLKNPLLVYNSRALNLELVNPQSPRVILFNEDASLILAYTKNPGNERIKIGQDDLEIIKFDQDKKAFDIGVLTFNGQNVPSNKQLQKTNSCLRCHGRDPVPLFKDYNIWAGFYGSFGTQGYAVKSSKEFKWMKEFIHSRSNRGRYQHLDFKAMVEDEKGIPTPLNAEGDYLSFLANIFPEIDFANIHKSVKFSTNLIFGSLVGRLMHKRTAKKIVSNRAFSEVAPIIKYLGTPHDRCGTFRERTKDIYDNGLVNDSEVRSRNLGPLLGSISGQVFKDTFFQRSRFLESNRFNEKVDPRGNASIAYSNFVGQFRFNDQLDTVAIRKQFVLMEVLYRHLGFNTGEISTSPDNPTTGIFHLSRLGRLLKDESYFESLYIAAELKSSTHFTQFSTLSCEEIRKRALSSASLLKVPNFLESGVLYFAH